MALHLFPTEVWELILEELENSADILNVFNAFPELGQENVLRKRLVVYIFEQIIPFVFTRLETADILSCRQVCRKWCRSIESFLESHPQRRAYSHNDGGHTTGQLWIPIPAPANYDLAEHFPGNIFNSRENFTEFMQKMGGHPPGRNPFIGGYVKIQEKGDCQDSPALEAFWDHCALEFVQKFGEHIWFLDVEFCTPWGESEVPLQMLRCLPNLRGLTMSLPDEYDFGQNPEDVPSTPFLPNLETLELDARVSHENLVELYIPQHFANIRRLIISYRNWQNEYSNLFPRLTQLTIFDMTTKDGISELLRSLNAPDLYELCIKSRARGFPPVSFDENIVWWLRRFRRIGSFKLTVPSIHSSTSLVGTRDVIASMTSLTLNGMSGTSVADFSMLRYFPCLEYFKVTGDHMKEKLDEKTVYGSSVWDLLPKLRCISVGDEEYSGIVRYSRARWEYLEKM